jgi:succinoglycan biosynthesis transport protein ExoP
VSVSLKDASPPQTEPMCEAPNNLRRTRKLLLRTEEANVSERRVVEILPHRWIRRLWGRRYLVGFAYLAVVWAAVAVLILTPVKYEVSAVLFIQPGLYGSDNDKYSRSSRPEEIARSQTALLESENVIRGAIGVVGVEGVRPASSLWLQSGRDPTDDAYVAAKNALRVRTEPYTSLIRVTFRHGDPKFAVDFTKALVQSFTDKHFELYSNVNAVAFFSAQQKQSNQAFARASSALAAFSSTNQVFSIENQRRLLLEQRSRLASERASTKGTIAEKESQVGIIPGQLSQMKPVNRLVQAIGLIQNQAKTSEESPPISQLATDPPLLLVRVYQDTVATLVKLNTELAGLRALAKHQDAEITKVDADLSVISAREAEFEMLRLEVTQAKFNSELFTKRAFDEQLSQDLNEKRLSSVQVVQQATLPLEPIWPPRLFISLGLLLSLLPLLAAPVVYHATRTARK